MQKLKGDTTALQQLKDTDLMVADFGQDIRGRRVIDRDRKHIGHVSSLFIDGDERKVRTFEIKGGGLLGMGDRHYLLPVEAITKVDDDSVYVSESADRVAKAPAYDPELVERYDRDYWGPYYGYYGHSPYWNDGYEYPNYHDWYGI